MNIVITSVEQIFSEEVVDRVIVRYHASFGDNDYINGNMQLSVAVYEANKSLSQLREYVVGELKTRIV